MDRALKERVVGAVALVAIAVLVVPVFLDGPSSDAEIVSETVVLPGQDEQTRKRQTIVLERDREQPVPASASRRAQATTAEEKLAADEAARKAADAAARKAASAEQAPEPRPQATPPEEVVAQAAQEEKVEAPREQQASGGVTQPDPPATAAPSPAQESATGMWAVQLGSFSNQANAERLAADLRKSGYAAFLSRHSTSSGALHRVRVGPQKDRASAEGVAGKLGNEGHKGQVVPHP